MVCRKFIAILIAWLCCAGAQAVSLPKAGLHVHEGIEDPVEGLPRFIGHDVLVFNSSNYAESTSAAAADLDKMN